MLQQVQLHPWLLLAAALICAPLLPPLVRFFLPLQRGDDRDDRPVYFDLDGPAGFWIPAEMLWPVLRLALLLAIYAVLTLGICCLLMVFLR